MKWLEEGSKIHLIFFCLEKQHANYNTIHQLNINETVTSDSKLISKFCSMFYSKLYTSNYSERLTSSFFASLEKHKSILPENKDLHDKPLSIKEIMDSIDRLKNNKSPGLTRDFYKCFTQKVALF